LRGRRRTRSYGARSARCGKAREASVFRFEGSARQAHHDQAPDRVARFLLFPFELCVRPLEEQPFLCQNRHALERDVDKAEGFVLAQADFREPIDHGQDRESPAARLDRGQDEGFFMATARALSDELSREGKQ